MTEVLFSQRLNKEVILRHKSERMLQDHLTIFLIPTAHQKPWNTFSVFLTKKKKKKKFVKIYNTKATKGYPTINHQEESAV